MRFLVDTNVLLYAANRDAPEHDVAERFLADHFREGTPWCLSWAILYEFLRVATHRSVFPRPLTASQAQGFVADLVGQEQVTILVPTSRHLQLLAITLEELSHPAGNLMHDVHTAVLAREHGVGEIVTADTDFLQFRFLKVTNPFR